MTGESRYLLAVYEAQRERGSPVSTGHLADRLDRSPATVTGALQRLEDHGLVTYEPYEGATLTDEGRSRGEQLHETYRTLSRFFRDVLELDDYEEEARELAGTVSPTVAQRLSTTLLAAEDTDGPD